MTQEVTIILNHKDASLFVEFQKHHDQIAKLLTARVFDIRNGAAVLHLDGAGNVKKVERHDEIYLDP